MQNFMNRPKNISNSIYNWSSGIFFCSLYFQNGTTHIVFFESETPLTSLDHMNITSLSPGLQRVQLLKPDIKEAELPSDTWTFEVTAPNVGNTVF